MIFTHNGRTVTNENTVTAKVESFSLRGYES